MLFNFKKLGIICVYRIYNKYRIYIVVIQYDFNVSKHIFGYFCIFYTNMEASIYFFKK